MARYIDANKVMEEIKQIGSHNLCGWSTIGVKDLIDRQPTADVVEVKHGYWIYHYSGRELGGTDAPLCQKCSVCGEYTVDEENFCPNCGAKMDGKALEER